MHCGFCLQSCPTFLVTGDEADSPRGRIVLMRAMAGGRLPPDDGALISHLDRCLGCRACEPACPSGVAYGLALEAARTRLAEVRPVPRTARAVHAVMAEPLLRTPILAAARAMRPVAGILAGPSRVGFVFGMLAATRPVEWEKSGRSGSGARSGRSGSPTPHTTTPAAERHGVAPGVAAAGGERGSGGAAAPAAGAVGWRGRGCRSPAVMFRGCIMDGLFSHVHAAAERVLRVNGYAIRACPGQQCCGALHAHAGQHESAAALARANVRALAAEPDAAIAVDSAGCGAMLKDYGRLLARDPLSAAAAAVSARVRDVTELLADAGPRSGAALDVRVAYDPPCHLLHAQRVADAPEAVLAAVPGLMRPAHAEADLCCGGAGSYSLTERDLSRRILARKVAALRDARPEVVVTGNPGCAMQIGAGLRAAGLRLPVAHPVELLDWSYERAGEYGD